MNIKPVIIDCDTGTDDAIAIIAALYSPELDIRAFTTVAGNVELKYTSRNTLNLVRYLDFDIRVALGAPQPILRKTILHSGNYTHGNTGLGSLVLPITKEPFYEKNAVETIYDEAIKSKGELELIAIGPLTNIAHALMVHPDLKNRLKKIIFMGGAVYGGNMTTTAEFNIWADPEAARIVLVSGIPLTMVGLDVTLKAALDANDAAEIKKVNTKASGVIVDILEFMFERHSKGGEDALMHDALAVAVCIDPSLIKGAKYFVDCECSGKYTSGHTFVAVTRMFRDEPNCYVAEKLDLTRFKMWIRKANANSVK